MLIITPDSHLDHNLTLPQLQHLLQRFKDRDAFFIETLELPAELDLKLLRCALVGPLVGDEPVTEDQVKWVERGERKYPSRMVKGVWRPTSQLTVIAGPHEDHSCILYTAYGGPLAPKEPDDPTLKDSEREASEAFWGTHALAWGAASQNGGLRWENV